MRKPVVKLGRRGDCHVGELEMPMQAGAIHVKALGWDPVSALRRASALAVAITTDPRLAPFLPPQAMMAAQTVHALTTMSAADLTAAHAEAKESGDRSTAKVAAKVIDSRRQYTGDVGADIGGDAKRRDYRRGSTQNRAERARYRGGKRITPTSKFGDREAITAKPRTAEREPRGPYTPPPDQAPGYPPQTPGGAYPTYGGSSEPLSPHDYMAMQAWGDDAFEQEAFAQYGEADQYFEGYEDRYDSGPYGLEPDPDSLIDEADANELPEE
jgi:hypothetical protein